MTQQTIKIPKEQAKMLLIRHGGVKMTIRNIIKMGELR
jgi:hypothetical protein